MVMTYVRYVVHRKQGSALRRGTAMSSVSVTRLNTFMVGSYEVVEQSVPLQAKSRN